MWFPEQDRRIYVSPHSAAFDPLDLRQRLVEISGGMVWALLAKRHDLYRALNGDPDTGAEASAETELAQVERKLVRTARQAFELGDGDPVGRANGSKATTDDEALSLLDHFVEWLSAKKASTAASPSC